ncbi:MAG: hypothetical protein KGZ96_07865 [Clostridia bacterium]|jgi:hypothetical protein|nr:hypothetical protein [Clostridia bacterium]
MSHAYRKVATGFSYFYAGAFVISFVALGMAALVTLVVIVAGLLGAFN